MAKRKQAAGAPAPVVTAKAPKGAVRVLVRVRKTGRTMRITAAEARALHAINVVEYVEVAPPPAVVQPTYQRRDMVARRPPPVPSSPVTFPMVIKGDGEAE